MEWVAPDGQRTRRNCSETCTIAEAYDRIYPPPKEEKQTRSAQSTDSTTPTTLTAQEGNPETRRGQEKDEEASHNIDNGDARAPAPPDAETPGIPAAETSQPESGPQDQPQSSSTPAVHRGLYFYLHRPRTATKQTVLIPLRPSNTFTASLRDRVVLEFPTVFVLPQSPQDLSQSRKEKEKEVIDCQYLLEEDYLRIYGPPPEEESKPREESEEEGAVNESTMTGLPDVDEKKVLEVLQQDLAQA